MLLLSRGSSYSFINAAVVGVASFVCVPCPEILLKKSILLLTIQSLVQRLGSSFRSGLESKVVPIP